MDTCRINTKEVQEFETTHAEQIRRLSAECMVLLKNDGTLPLEGPGKIALYGSGARKTIKGGTGSGDVNVRHFVNVEEGLENAGFTITTKKWLDDYDELVWQAKEEFFAGLRKEADAAGVNPVLFALGRTAPEPEYELPLDGEGDTAVYVLARISGEGADRQNVPGDIRLTSTEIRDILKLNQLYPHFALVLNTGGMVDLSPVSSVGTILQMGQLGSATGDSLADVLLGKECPSGKLAMTWAPLEEYPSTEGFGDPDDTLYKEGIYVGYRYFDTAKKTPVFPFGFGLGYTSFEIRTLSLAADEKQVKVTVQVTNTGSRPGKEVVQVYYSAPAGKLDKPFQELAAFKKTRKLEPQETEVLEISFDTGSMASYDKEEASYILEKGLYLIRVGNSSRNTEAAGALSLDQTAVVCKLKNVCGESGFADLVLPSPNTSIEEGVTPVIPISAREIETTTVSYRDEPEEIPAGSPCTWQEVKSGEKTLDEFIGGLTDEQLSLACVGNYKNSTDVMEIVGNASETVAGAAGETTGYLKDLGVPALIMADGPAGVRISSEYQITDGKPKGSSSIGGDVLLVFTPQEREAMAPAPSSSGETFYQYCSAIPIGTCIAQSFNEDLARECGRIAGDEMKRFGIHIWLAPALNIQRSPLCGRNFEYYSEDPLIGGTMAAAITSGVQEEGGETTIKHFACNNQETNRFFSNSQVGERALREIYLKGFEICVRKVPVKFIMTSYNLINGTHSCNSRDLLTAVLRDEWGYEGAVMTDWLVTGGMGPGGAKWPCASAAGNVKAGNDLTMPGTPADKEDIVKARLESTHPFALTRAELQTCARRVLKRVLAAGE